MSVIDEASATPLDPKLMKALLTCLVDMPTEQRCDMAGRAIGLIRFLEDHLSDQDTHARAAVLISFEFRMEAMTRLRKRAEYRAWAIKATRSGAPDLINDIMIDTAAAEPLIERNKRPAFDPASFFRKALELAQAEGRA
jgi:hypothetical protein